MSAAEHEPWPGDSFVAALPEEDRAALLAAGRPRRFADGEILLRQGYDGNFVYVLLSGVVRVVGETEEGRTTVLALRSRGDLVGEFALLDGRPRVATVRAAGQVSALKLAGAEFTAVIGRSGAARRALDASVLAKLRSATGRSVADRLCEAGQRIARELCELGLRHGLRGDGGLVRLPLTQSDLADLAGVSVSTAERVLRELREAGDVTTKYREITIVDLSRLRSAASGTAFR